MLNKEMLLMGDEKRVGDLVLEVRWHSSIVGSQVVNVYRNESLVYTVRPGEAIKPVEVSPGDLIYVATVVPYYVEVRYHLNMDQMGEAGFRVVSVPCGLSISLDRQ